MEGLRTRTYSDSGGVATIGCGHTGAGVREKSITTNRAYELLRADVARFEKCVADNMRVPITQGMFDAMVSLAFNMGCTGAMKNAGIADLVNAKRYQEAAQKILSVGLRDRAGNYLRGLESRRRIESAMFMRDGLPSGARTATRPVLERTTGTQIPNWSYWVAGGVIGILATATVMRKVRQKSTTIKERNR